ncbi:MAG: hypothetical protein ACKO3R_07700 [bacterium]
MVLNTARMTSLSSYRRPIITEAEAALVTTGGTIGSNQEKPEPKIKSMSAAKILPTIYLVKI